MFTRYRIGTKKNWNKPNHGRRKLHATKYDEDYEINLDYWIHCKLIGISKGGIYNFFKCIPRLYQRLTPQSNCHTFHWILRPMLPIGRCVCVFKFLASVLTMNNIIQNTWSQCLRWADIWLFRMISVDMRQVTFKNIVL